MDELLDMPSDVERAARVKVGHTHACAQGWERAKPDDVQKEDFTLCVSLFCRTYWSTVLNPLR